MARRYTLESLDLVGIEYVPDAHVSLDYQGAPTAQELENEILSGIHTNQDGTIGCLLCGCVDMFYREFNTKGRRYRCMSCFYNSEAQFESVKSQKDITLSSFGLVYVCDICGEEMDSYNKATVLRHLKKHEDANKVSEAEGDYDLTKHYYGKNHIPTTLFTSIGQDLWRKFGDKNTHEPEREMRQALSNPIYFNTGYAGNHKGDDRYFKTFMIQVGVSGPITYWVEDEEYGGSEFNRLTSESKEMLMEFQEEMRRKYHNESITIEVHENTSPDYEGLGVFAIEISVAAYNKMSAEGEEALYWASRTNMCEAENELEVPRYVYHATPQKYWEEIQQQGGMIPQIGYMTYRAFLPRYRNERFGAGLDISPEDYKEWLTAEIGGHKIWATSQQKSSMYGSMIEPMSLLEDNAILQIDTTGLNFEYYDYEEYFTNDPIPLSSIKHLYFMAGERYGEEYPDYLLFELSPEYDDTVEDDEELAELFHDENYERFLRAAEDYEIRRWLKVLRDEDPDWDDIDWEDGAPYDDDWHDDIDWQAENYFPYPLRDNSPRKSAAVLFVTNDGLVGLGLRSSRLRAGNTWAAIGGFSERGETPVQTIYREVYEELGIRLPNRVEWLGSDGIHEVYLCRISKPFNNYRLNWEHTDFAWKTLGEWKKQRIHPQLLPLLGNKTFLAEWDELHEDNTEYKKWLGAYTKKKQKWDYEDKMPTKGYKDYYGYTPSRTHADKANKNRLKNGGLFLNWLKTFAPTYKGYKRQCIFFEIIPVKESQRTATPYDPHHPPNKEPAPWGRTPDQNPWDKTPYDYKPKHPWENK